MCGIERHAIARSQAERIELRGAMAVNAVPHDQLIDVVLQQPRRFIENANRWPARRRIENRIRFERGAFAGNGCFTVAVAAG